MTNTDRHTAVVLGVGAARGLGAALARRFAAQGCRVLLVGRTEDVLKERCAEITAAGGAADYAVADVTSEDQITEAFAKADKMGPVEAVLYNAGNNALIPFADISPSAFEKFWRVCCFGAFLSAQAALPRLEQTGGSLIFTGASASLRGKANFAHFASAKGALRNLAQAIAREYGPKGVHVAHVIIDGVINGDIIKQRFAQYLESLGPDGTLQPDDIAQAFWSLHTQPKSTWSFEMDLRPYRENW